MFKQLLAGIMIGLGGYVNLTVGGLEGAILFSIGLLSVIKFKLPLYTGMVSKKECYHTPDYLFITLMFNIVGAVLLATLVNMAGYDFSVMEIKENKTALQILFDSYICGLCVSIAVKYKHEIITILAVTLFIVCGGEHCIADAFYFGLNNSFGIWKTLMFFFLVIVGNTVGGITFLGIDDKKEI